MKYLNRDIDKSEIVQSFENDGNWYYKKYADGSDTIYYSEDENEIEKIRKEMVEQAKKRQELMKPDYYKGLATLYLSASIISFALASKITNPELSGWFILLAIGGVMSFIQFVKCIKIKNELKKYERFLEIYNQDTNVNKYVHDLYSPYLNIETLDEFHNADMSIVFDEFKKTKKITNK